MFVEKMSVYGFSIWRISFAERPRDVRGCDRVRFDLCRENVDVPGFRKDTFYRYQIDLTKPLEKIKSEMHRNARYELQRAEKEGITFKIDSDYENFLELHNKFSREKFGRYALAKNGELNSRNGKLFTAYFKGEMIAWHYFVHDDRLFIANLSGSVSPWRSEYKRLIGYATRYLHWQAITYAKSAGFKAFSIGGVRREDGGEVADGVGRYKASFGGEMVEDYYYTKTYSPFLKVIGALGVLDR
ncbi:MAG: peptidoglycan bridge formation glycyltransferase FemA/FemB family protein [Candidatus Micrarchaeota archaeon]|nr:peptidoglycan bridge formation glycyltransferase FemA/FemB family protein [Candidatus Micrarchaeota archaeon]